MTVGARFLAPLSNPELSEWRPVDRCKPNVAASLAVVVNKLFRTVCCTGSDCSRFHIVLDIGQILSKVIGEHFHKFGGLSVILGAVIPSATRR